jgi:hypothetical protein
VHVLNRDYDAAKDTVRPRRGVALVVDREALWVSGAKVAAVLAPGVARAEVPVSPEGRLSLDLAGGWALVVLPRG